MSAMSDCQFMLPIVSANRYTSKRLSDKRSDYCAAMRESTRTDYANRLLQARTKAGLTQTKLAKLAGMSQSSYAQAETTGVGSAYTPQIAKICGVSAEWLATGEGEIENANVWPFVLVTQEQIQQLTPTHLEMLQKFSLFLLSTQGSPIASQPPTTDTASSVSRRRLIVEIDEDGDDSGASNPDQEKKSSSA